MSEVIKGFTLQVNDESAVKSMKTLRSEIEATQTEVDKLTAKFGKNSSEVETAQQRLAHLQKTIADKQERQNLMIDNAAKTITGLSAAYGGLQGALEITGMAGEDTIKSLAKIQSALAIGDAVQNLAEFRTAIGSTFSAMKTGAVAAFNTIKGAIGSTGIGLLVIALGAIVAYWDEIKSAVSGVSEEQQNLLETTNATAKAEKEKLDHISDQDNILKLQGKTEREILKMKIAQTDQVIAANEAQILAQKSIEDSQVKTAQRNKDILEGILKFVSLPITTVLKGIDLIGSAVGKNFDLEKKFFGGIAGLVFNPEDVKSKSQETLKETENALIKLKNQRAGYLLQMQQLDKQSAIDNAKKLEEIQLANELKRLDKLKTPAANPVAIEVQTTQQLMSDHANWLAKFDSDKIKNAWATHSTLMSIHDAEIEGDKKLKEAKIAAQWEMADATMGALSAVADLFGRQTAIGKSIALAEIGFGVTKGFINGLTIAQQSAAGTGPGAVFAFPIFYASQVAAVLQAAARAKSILASTPGGGGGGPTISSGGGMSSAAPLSPQMPVSQITRLDNQSINQIGNATARAYVVESDITNNQEKIRRINRAARLG